MKTSTYALVIDGRDGAVTRDPAPETRLGTFAEVHPAPDLDGDGLDDYVFVDNWLDYKGALADRGFGSVVARSSRTGREVWHSEQALQGSYPSVYATGDLTGDGVPDLAVNSYVDPTPLNDHEGPSSWPLHAIDGSDGSILWSSGGWHLIDGGGRSKRDRFVMLATPVIQGRITGIQIDALNGTGEHVYSEFHRMEDVGDPWIVVTYLYMPGDLNADAHPEFLVYQIVGGDSFATQRFVSDGLTGERSDLPDGVAPLFASLDGRGADLGRATVDKRNLRIRVPWSPRASSPSFRAEFAVPEGFGRYVGGRIDAANVSGTSCPEILVSFVNHSEYEGHDSLLVIDATTGRVRWTSHPSAAASIKTIAPLPARACKN